MMIMFFFGNSIYAQKELFKVIPSEGITLNDSEQKIVTYFTGNNVKSVKYVELLNLGNSDSLSHFTFKLPNQDEIFEAQNDLLDFTNENSYNWVGKIKKGELTQGDMCIMRTQEGFGGYFQHLDGYEALIPLSPKRGLLLEYDLTKNRVCKEGGIIENGPKDPTEKDPCDRRKCTPPQPCEKTLDIQCIIAADVWKDLGLDPFKSSILLQILPQLAGIQTNQILKNSLVYGKVRVKVTGVPTLVFNTVGLDEAGIVKELTTKLKSATPPINIQGDIICIITTKGTMYPIAGLSLGPDIFALDISYLTSSDYVFTHELGHNLGAHHEYQKNQKNCLDWGGRRFPDGTALCAHAHLLTDAKGDARGTVMASGESFHTHIPHFSNPLVTWMGLPTSSGADREYNAAVVQNGLCIMSDFKSNPDINLSIKTVVDACGGTFTVSASPMGTFGIAPYTYKWEWSTNNLFSNSKNIANSTAILTITEPFSCSFYYLKCTVTSADGVVTSINSPKINPTWCPKCQNGGMKVFNNQNSNFLIYPNPTSDYVKIIFKSDNTSNTIFSIVDGVGRNLFSQSQEIIKGYNEIDMNLSSYGSGLYYIKCENSNTILVEKILIQH
jgi:hypothetical protein